MTPEQIIEEAKTRFKYCVEAERDIREQAKIDHEFMLSKQWPEQARQVREQQKRPCLTQNLLPQYVNSVANEFRQNLPSIEAKAAGESADNDTADIITGLCKSIEVKSNAESAYVKAQKDMVIGGFGHVRICADYKDEDSWDQELFIERVRDPFSIYLDPGAQKYDRSDGDFAFVIERMSKDEFKRRWPKAELSNANDFSNLTEQDPDWFQKDEIQVAEYWKVKHDRVKKFLFRSQGGDSLAIEEGQDAPEGFLAVVDQSGKPLSKMFDKRTVCCYYINGIEVLETAEWPGKYIPIVPFYAEEYFLDGKRHLVGLVRNMRDAQVRYNAMISAEAEAIALTPKAPYIAPVGSTAGLESIWENANTDTYSVLYYKARPELPNGGKPERQFPTTDISSISAAIKQADNDMKAANGIYSASLGQGGPETSGKAIMARQKEGDTATFNYLHNAALSISHVGRILVDLLPYYYNESQVVNIVKPDGQQEAVKINELFQDEAGKDQHYDLTVGRYDVTVSTGPSYSTQKEQTFDRLTQFVQAYPELLQICGDMIFRAAPLQAGLGEQMAERMEKMLPPQLQPQNPEQQQIPQAIQAQMQQLMAQHDQLVQALTAAQAQVEDKQAERDLKMKLALIDKETKLTLAELQANAQAGQLLLAQQMKATQQSLDHVQQFLMAGADHESQMQQAAHQASLEPSEPGAGPANPADQSQESVNPNE